MKYLLIAAAILLVLVLVVVVIGYLLPVAHTATKTFTVKAPPDSVWQRLTDFKNYPAWRKDLSAVVATSDTSWIETDRRKHQMPVAIIIYEPYKQLATKINGSNLPFGGTWVFVLKEANNQTMVTITEHGEVYNPVFRFVSRFIMGYYATINQYADDLEKVSIKN